MEPLPTKRNKKLLAIIDRQYEIIEKAERRIKKNGELLEFCEGEPCTCNPKVVKVEAIKLNQK